ncbi:conjugal transfer protein TraL [Caballeronia sp. LZ016]|uniref:nucleotide-binding protein n=1 Tax=Caballeronia sp. LZ016 TaxID=3038554 RepID=UPI00286266D1|nr:conjugal transfer protein TraL [Caballeronia sp. LZ016]MDR5740074.1 conjugal transfer protein TraL [Caballeronia sp. LZ016]
MTAIHLVLQGKGGVGKSLIAALLAQYLAGRSDKLFCADTDPVNDTFSRYEAFQVRKLELLTKSQQINTREFDGLVESILQHDGNAVIDNGASTFLPLSAYMVENETVQFLNANGKKVVLHTVLTGGQSFDDTTQGLLALLANQDAPVVVWENEFFGPVEKDGRRFRDSKLYDQNKSRIRGIVTIDRRNEDTFGKDIEMLVSNKLTFDQAMESPLFSIMPRQRLKIVKKSIFDQLDTLAI